MINYTKDVSVKDWNELPDCKRTTMTFKQFIKKLESFCFLFYNNQRLLLG